MLVNPITGNLVDHVAAAFAEYKANGGLLTGQEWHRKLAPEHPECNLCHDFMVVA